jgi:hypothetical protein
MSAGKVMLGTDGNPLRSADGKIVLADDLYPMWLNPSLATHGRYNIGYDEVLTCPAADVWNELWAGQGVDANFGMGAYGTGEYSWVQQHGIILTFSDSGVDWSRTKAVKIGLDIATGNFPAGMTLRITASKNITDGVMPAGKSVRDDWTTIKTYTSTTEESFSFTIDTNGTQPDTVGIAAVWDVDTCPLSPGGGWEYFECYGYLVASLPVQVIYNLATA